MAINVVHVKPGVQFSVIGPAGFRILAAIDRCSLFMMVDLTITSACEGEHSGPGDPHHSGEAYDIRTHGLSEKEKRELVRYLDSMLGPRFFVFIEAPGRDGEHIHVQRAKGTQYP